MYSIGNYYGWKTSDEYDFGNVVAKILQMVQHSQGIKFIYEYSLKSE